MNLQSLFQKSKGCSQCCEGQLAIKEPVRETGADKTGTDNSGSWAYYECDRCGFRVKESTNGRTELPDDAEWNQFCGE
jgi:hypothetical protein